MDPNQSVYDSDTDDEMMMVKKKECTFFGYFCPKIGDELKYTQSEQMAPWIQLQIQWAHRKMGFLHLSLVQQP